jgi:hypothetical protein
VPPLLPESDARNSEAYPQVSFFNRLGDAIRGRRDGDPFWLPVPELGKMLCQIFRS